MALAAISLPVPLSPVISTFTRLSRIRSIRRTTCWIFGPVAEMPWVEYLLSTSRQQVGVLLRQLVLAAPQFADQLRRSRWQWRRATPAPRANSSSRWVKPPTRLFSASKRADDGALLVAHGHGQHVARAVAGAGRRSRCRTADRCRRRCTLTVWPVVTALAGDSQARVEAQNLVAAQRHFGPQLVALAVQQENAGAVAIQQVGGFARDQVQQRAQIALGIHLLADGQNGGQPLVKFRLRQRTHWRLSLSHRARSVHELDSAVDGVYSQTAPPPLTHTQHSTGVWPKFCFESAGAAPSEADRERTAFRSEPERSRAGRPADWRKRPRAGAFRL